MVARTSFSVNMCDTNVAGYLKVNMCDTNVAGYLKGFDINQQARRKPSHEDLCCAVSHNLRAQGKHVIKKPTYFYL